MFSPTFLLVLHCTEQLYTYLIGALRHIKKISKQTVALQFLVPLKDHRDLPSLCEQVFKTAAKILILLNWKTSPDRSPALRGGLMKQFTFPGSNRCDQCLNLVDM